MTQNKKGNYLLPILMMIALFAMISFVTGLTNPIGVIVKHQFHAAEWMTQLGNFANFIAYACMGYPAGLLLQKKGYKYTALLAIAVGFIGVGIQFYSGSTPDHMAFGVYLIGCFISGFSMCLLNSVVNPMLNTLGGGGKTGNQLIQTGGTFNSISATIVPVFVGYLIGSNVEEATINNAAPALFIAMGIFALAFIVLFFMRIPEPFLAKTKEDKNDKYSALSFRHFRLGIIAIFVYVGVEVGIPNFVFLLLTTSPTLSEGAKGIGMDAAAAGSIVGTYWFLMMVGRLFGSTLGGKISAKAQLIFTSSLGMIFVLIGIFAPLSMEVAMPVFHGGEAMGFGMQTVPMNVMFFILCGLCTSIMWGGIFNLAVEGIGKYTSMASGIFMIMVCGGGILPLIQGGVVTATENYLNGYWIIFAAMGYMLWYALLGCKNVNTDISVD
ncbi:MAG: MFS transporter [Bacteroidaceae bacterium]